MKVTLKVDAELVPIITRAIKEYTERSLADMVVTTPPAISKPAAAVVSKPAKRRGRPIGSKTRKQKVATVVLAAPAQAVLAAPSAAQAA